MKYPTDQFHLITRSLCGYVVHEQMSKNNICSNDSQICRQTIKEEK